MPSLLLVDYAAFGYTSYSIPSFRLNGLIHFKVEFAHAALRIRKQFTKEINKAKPRVMTTTANEGMLRALYSLEVGVKKK